MSKAAVLTLISVGDLLVHTRMCVVISSLKISVKHCCVSLRKVLDHSYVML